MKGQILTFSTLAYKIQGFLCVKVEEELDEKGNQTKYLAYRYVYSES